MLCAAGVVLGSCGMREGKTGAGLPPTPPIVAAPGAGARVQDAPVKIGNPYQVGGQTYVPSDVPGYDEVGYASWYGAEAGVTTANGETFNPNGISGAHKTLPLPSYVEVTALDTGRTILVRLNDRGPFVGNRLIDLSRGAAGQLGISADGATPVRVRRVNPPEQERAVLRSGGHAALRLETPASLLVALRAKLAATGDVAAIDASEPMRAPAAKAVAVSKVISAPQPKPVPTPKPVIPNAPRSASQSAPAPAPAKGGYVVQVAAVSSREGAEKAAKSMGASISPAGKLWRVRLGPYASMAAAKRGVEQVAAAGFKGAQIMVND